MARSLLALMEPTLAISSCLVTTLRIEMRCSMAASTPRSIPRRMAAGLLPAAMLRRPSLKIARARHGCRRRAVTGNVRSLRSDLVDQLGSHVLELVFKFDLFADGDAVLGDRGAAERLVEDHVSACRAHGDRDQHRPASQRPEEYAFGLDRQKEVALPRWRFLMSSLFWGFVPTRHGGGGPAPGVRPAAERWTT